MPFQLMGIPFQMKCLLGFAFLGLASAAFWHPVPFEAIEENNGDGWDAAAAHIVNIVSSVAPDAEARKAYIRKHISTLKFEFLEEQIPHLFDDVDVTDFMDRVSTCGRQNTYLNNFMKRAAEHRPAFFSDKDDHYEVIPDAVFYATVLDRLTEACRNDRSIVSKMYDSIMQSKEHIEWQEYFNLFEKAKMLTMDHVISRYMDMLESAEVPSNWGRRTLPLNIVEASLEDFRLGNKLNAEVALIMAFEPPGDSTVDPKTNAGPSTLSEDGNAIRYAPPRPDLYADLYSTWNSAFVSHYDNAPHFWAKLLNPQVGCYQDDPELYVYNRAIALWLHVYFEMFNRVERGSADPWYHWADQDLTSLWEAVNFESGEHYLNTLDEARPGMANAARKHMKTLMRDFASSSGQTLTALQNAISDLSELAITDNLSLSKLVKMIAGYGSVVVNIIRDLFS